MWFNAYEKYIPNEEERRRYVLEECLYFADINSTNILICKKILDPNNKYKLNAYCGNTLKLDIKEVFGIECFDVIIGNPPFDDGSGNKGKTHILWEPFVCTNMDMLSDDGFLSFIHPGVWRQKDHRILELFKIYQLHYLEIHNVSDGKKMFNANTQYDWYV